MINLNALFGGVQIEQSIDRYPCKVDVVRSSRICSSVIYGGNSTINKIAMFFFIAL